LSTGFLFVSFLFAKMAQDTPEAPAGAVAAPSLSDFFSKKKKKIATTNLNKDTTTSKPEASKPKKKDAEDSEWQHDEEIVATTLKVDAAKNLASLNDGKDEEDASAPAWSNIKKEKKETAGHLKPHMYPSLARSMIHKHAVGVHDDDIPAKGMTAKNAFSALGGGADDSDDEGRQTHKPVTANRKQKGEMERKAVEKDKGGSKASRESAADDDDEPQDAREGSGDDSPKEKPKKKVGSVKSKAQAAAEADDEEKAVDLLIEVDLKAAEAKYVGRRKLPVKAIPSENLEEEKVSKAPVAAKGGRKKAFKNFDDEDDKQLQYVEE